MREREYIVFCDESDTTGKFFSNFYGGLIVGSSQHDAVTKRLNEAKTRLNLYGEIKWEKVTELYLSKYQEIIRLLFSEIAGGNIKIRIMFRQNAQVPQYLTKEQIELEYFLLYYQFVKHGLGLAFIDSDPHGVRLKLYFDQFPDTREKIEKFKGYLLGLKTGTAFRQLNIALHPEDITEVRSHDHVLLQCLDIVLGSVSFRLNDKHKAMPSGQHRRGKRTVAKEKLYKTILAEIRKLRPNFNFGISTGCAEPAERWTLPYRHWSFIPASANYERHRTKRSQEKKKSGEAPTSPTSISDA